MNSTAITLSESQKLQLLSKCFERHAAWLSRPLNLLDDPANGFRVNLEEGACLTLEDASHNAWRPHSPEGQTLLWFRCFPTCLRVDKAFTNLLICSEDELMGFLLVCDPAETDTKGSSPGSVTLPNAAAASAAATPPVCALDAETDAKGSSPGSVTPPNASDDAAAATPPVCALDLTRDQLFSLALMPTSNFPIPDGEVSVAITKKQEERHTTATHVCFISVVSTSFKDCDDLVSSLSICSELAVPMLGTKTFRQESSGHCVCLLGFSPSVDLAQHLSILLSRVSVTSSNTRGTLCGSEPLHETESDSDESSESESENGPMLSATRAVGPPADARDSAKKSFC